MPRFLVDECLPRSVTRSLLAAGYDAVDVRDIGLRGESDAAIHQRATDEGLVYLLQRTTAHSKHYVSVALNLKAD